MKAVTVRRDYMSTGSLVERNLSAQFHKDPCRPRNHGPAGVFRMFLGQKRRAHKLDEHTRAVIAGRSFLNKNSQRELAREYAVSTGTIANICSEFSQPPLKSKAIAAAEQYYRTSPAWRMHDSRRKPSVDSKFAFHLPTSFWGRRCDWDVSCHCSRRFGNIGG